MVAVIPTDRGVGGVTVVDGVNTFPAIVPKVSLPSSYTIVPESDVAVNVTTSVTSLKS